MTAEIARRTENLPVEYISERPMRLVEWAEEARAAHALAEALCQTPFAGAYANNPGGATAAILKGAEVGLTPVTALGSFDLIQGTPAPKALTLRALVQSHGHRVWIESSTDAECVAKAVRRGESEVHVSKWTIKRAQLMNLTGKKNWKEQPAAMLMARATSEVCRLVAADVILGIGYSAEELRDEEPAPTVRVSRAKAVAAPMPEPEFDTPQTDDGATATADSAEASPTPSPAPSSEPPITKAQSRMLHALLNKHGMSEREDYLLFLSRQVDRALTTSDELTKAEASRIIDSAQGAVTDVEPEPGF